MQGFRPLDGESISKQKEALDYLNTAAVSVP